MKKSQPQRTQRQRRKNELVFDYHTLLRYALAGVIGDALACVETGDGWVKQAAYRTSVTIATKFHVYRTAHRPSLPRIIEQCIENGDTDLKIAISLMDLHGFAPRGDWPLDADEIARNLLKNSASSVSSVVKEDRRRA